MPAAAAVCGDSFVCALTRRANSPAADGAPLVVAAPGPRAAHTASRPLGARHGTSRTGAVAAKEGSERGMTRCALGPLVRSCGIVVELTLAAARVDMYPEFDADRSAGGAYVVDE